MKLKFSRFDAVINFDVDKIHTLEVHDRHLFARMVEALQSELGDKAIEPYLLFDKGKRIAPKGKMLLLSDFPSLPIHDRALEKLLYAKMAVELTEGASEVAGEEPSRLIELVEELNRYIDSVSVGMWGTYSFGLDWDVIKYLKAFTYGISMDENASLVDKCINFFGLCVDIGFKKPLVGINFKSFFCKDELNQLFEQAIFHGIPLFLLETWKDENSYINEKKMVIDQWLLEL